MWGVWANYHQKRKNQPLPTCMISISEYEWAWVIRTKYEVLRNHKISKNKLLNLECVFNKLIKQMYKMFNKLSYFRKYKSWNPKEVEVFYPNTLDFLLTKKTSDWLIFICSTKFQKTGTTPSWRDEALVFHLGERIWLRFNKRNCCSFFKSLDLISSFS